MGGWRAAARWWVTVMLLDACSAPSDVVVMECPAGQTACRGACITGPCPSCAPNLLHCANDGPSSCGYDSLSNPLRCGACLTRCLSGPGFNAECRQGVCVSECLTRIVTCDGAPRAICDRDVRSSDARCGPCERACAADATCREGQCEPRAIRPKAPISALRLHSARPRFRWELANGADGARLDLCTSRACDRVENSWDIVGTSFRPPSPLAAGVHFWRVTARHGDRLDGPPSSPWQFAVGAAPSDALSTSALLDVNGDGLEDRFIFQRSPPAPRWRVEVYLSTGGTDSTEPGVVLQGNTSWQDFDLGRIGSEVEGRGPIALGDVNGDGFADVGCVELARSLSTRGTDLRWSSVLVFLGGADGPSATPHVVDLASTIEVMAAGPVGDRDGDGHGDMLVLLDPYSILDGYEVAGGSFASTWNRSLDETSWFTNGDFDADGYEDLVTARARGTPGFPFRYKVHRGSPRRPFDAGNELGDCAAPGTSPYWIADGTRVVDFNDDGYDDLLLAAPPGEQRPLYLGGPTGLDGSRCVTLPPSP